MKIYSVCDPEFKPYGKVLEGYDTKELLDAMMKIDLPEDGVAYEPGIASLEACAIYRTWRTGASAACRSSWACAGAATPS